jgi:hypothetical protein
MQFEVKMKDHDDPSLSWWYGDPSLSWWYNSGDDDSHSQLSYCGPRYPKKRHYTPENNCADERAVELANELVETKNKINELQAKEKELKYKLLKTIPHFCWVNVNDEWIVANEKYKPPKRFNRESVLYFLMKTFGSKVAEAVAKEFSYVRHGYQAIFVKKNNLTPVESDLFSGEDRDVPY